ncbi:transcription termination factor MTERF2, chloroplastic-like [Ananas comosus]|uniref:Transcription termination factor MTERF2, chloroplastic-like n=1 Tax=Ananas comosus TaxID=4615 RepID=A0A199UNF6_ANACO|nr:transcription termination factor MTERF2, chloroplastic-like [Ananas comosus]OAY66308.1 hypothetical protein ACMD2_06373 [Ananas comosus]
MAPLLQKLSFLLRTSSSSSHLLRSLLLSTATASKKPQNPYAPESHFMVDYLVSSIGLSRDQAIKASKGLAHLRSPDRPDAVVGFLKRTGLSDAHIKSLISWHPKLLCANTEKTLERRAKELEEGGFSGPLLVQVVRSNPFAFTINGVLQRLQFWKEFVGGDNTVFSKVVRRNRMLINYDIERKVVPNITLLRNYGLSDKDITLVMMRVNGFILRSPISIKHLLKQTEDLGFSPESKMFVQALSVVAMIKSTTLQKKIELFKSFGWSKDEVHKAFRKCPNVLSLAEENVRLKMDFLLGKAGCLPVYIKERPMLLAYSLEKRLVPRHHVMSILKEKGIGKYFSFYSVVGLPEKNFVEKFIRRNEKGMPGLDKVYAAACAGVIPT